MHYTKYFELADDRHEAALSASLEQLLTLEAEARSLLGDEFYVTKISRNPRASYDTDAEPLQSFAADVRENFRLEKALHAKLSAENLTDFVICGGGFEGHKIKKEVNFSDTYIKEDGLCRIPGTYRGKAFSTINAHGWFSYEVRVKPNTINTLVVAATGSDGHIDFDVTIGEDRYEVRDTANEQKEFTFSFSAGAQDNIRVRFDRVSGYTPFLYVVKLL